MPETVLGERVVGQGGCCDLFAIAAFKVGLSGIMGVRVVAKDDRVEGSGDS